MSEIEKDKLEKRLAELEIEHLKLSNILFDLELGPHNQLDVQRIKKRKLYIKDQINLAKSELYPDIIA